MATNEQGRPGDLPGRLRTTAPAETGSVVDGRYTLLERIGGGGSGDVWRADDTRLDREVALKFVASEGLLAEAFVAGRLAHPNIVPVYDAGTWGGSAFVVMEYCPGGSLADRIGSGGPLPTEEAAAIVGQLASAVAFAHSQGVLHNDIKPANVLFGPSGEPRLADFGLATPIPRDTLTRADSAEFAGTLPYLAPEVIGGAEPGVRSDIYALGATLFECLSGLPPRASGWLSLPMDVAVDRPLGDVLIHTLHPDPGGRFASADALVRALGASQAAPETAALTASRPALAATGMQVVQSRRPHRRAAAMLAVVSLGLIAAGSVALGAGREAKTPDAGAAEPGTTAVAGAVVDATTVIEPPTEIPAPTEAPAPPVTAESGDDSHGGRHEAASNDDKPDSPGRSDEAKHKKDDGPDSKKNGRGDD